MITTSTVPLTYTLTEKCELNVLKSHAIQIKQIYCYCSLCKKFAKQHNLPECNMIAFFHYVNFPLSSRCFFRPWSPLFHATMKYKRNLWHWITKTHESRNFFDHVRKKIVYTRLTTLCQSTWNSSAQLTYTRAVLYMIIFSITNTQLLDNAWINHCGRGVNIPPLGQIGIIKMKSTHKLTNPYF